MYFPPLPEIFCAASLFCVCEQKKKPRRPFWGAKWQLPLRVTSQGKWTRRGENLIGDGGERRRTTLEARIPGIANAVSPYWSISIGADSAEGREREIQFAAACVCVPLAYTDDRLSRRWHWQKKKKRDAKRKAALPFDICVRGEAKTREWNAQGRDCIFITSSSSMWRLWVFWDDDDVGPVMPK